MWVRPYLGGCRPAYAVKPRAGVTQAVERLWTDSVSESMSRIVCGITLHFSIVPISDIMST
jgi:hypothetical protein